MGRSFHGLAFACACFSHGIALAASQSISSCGGPKDHLSNVHIALSPDPLSRGSPFTLTITGSLDEDIVGGTVAVDLEVKALGVVDKTIKDTITYSLSPGLRKGDQKIVVGPVSLPRDPGQAVLKGQVRLANTKGEPITCVQLNLDVPVLAEPEAEEVPAADLPVSASLCSKPTDHLKNIKSSKAGTQTTITATLDEDLTSFTANVDLSVHALFVHIPIKLSIPISYSPGVQKADWTIVGSTESADNGYSKMPVSVTGQVVVKDAQNEEVTCISLSSSETADVVV